MRMTRLRDEESGAVLVFVAVSLVVLLGMTALTVDLGRAVAIKRDMVNAADAAALAGAQACMYQREAGAARSAALETSTLNGADGDFQFDAPLCAAGANATNPLVVTVTSKTFVKYFIAPILGFDGTGVVASATAVVFPTGATNPVPFVADRDHTRTDCNLGEDGEDPAIDTPCYFWFDNDDFSGSTFGTLNLNAWNVSENENCADKELGANSHYAEIGGYDGPQLPPLNYPDPTWVCAATGNAQPMYTSLAEAVGKIIALPLTDGCVTQGSHCEAFNVVDFTRLELTGVFRANEAPAECGPPPANGSATCITTTWQGRGRGTTDPIPGGSGAFFDIRLVR
jgi:Flp pilus assembly protein TadG